MADADYPFGFYFEFSCKSGETTGFQEISGISREISVEEVVCGGENRFKYRLPIIATSQNLVLKGALTLVKSDLVEWCSNCIGNGFANKIETRDVSVSLLGEGNKTLIMWTFFNAYPIKYSVSDLKSQENSLVIQSMELAYTYFDIAKKS